MALVPAVAQIQSLLREPLYAAGCSLKKKKKSQYYQLYTYVNNQAKFKKKKKRYVSLSLSCLITFINFFLFQLVDFEAMTAPGSEAFSKIAKSWMNLKR